MSNDPYVMEESHAARSRALGSSLWEVRALRRHWEPAVSRTAALVLRAAEQRDQPVDLAPDHDAEVSTHLHTAPEYAGRIVEIEHRNCYSYRKIIIVGLSSSSCKGCSTRKKGFSSAFLSIVLSQ